MPDLLTTPQYPYRAAVWISSDGRRQIAITTPHDADLPDHQLLAMARVWQADTGWLMGVGTVAVVEAR